MNVTDNTVIQQSGTLALVLLSVALAWIALQSRHYERYGREALLCASAYLLTQAALRTLSINGWVSSSTARVLVSVSAFCALGILTQIVLLRRKEHVVRSSSLPKGARP